MPTSEAEDGYRAERESTVEIQDLADVSAGQGQGLDGTRLDSLEHAQGVSLAAAALGEGPILANPGSWFDEATRHVRDAPPSYHHSRAGSDRGSAPSQGLAETVQVEFLPE